MELFNNHILSECFVEGSETHQKLKKMKKETQSNERDVDASKTLRVESLNNLREIMDKMNERELGR